MMRCVVCKLELPEIDFRNLPTLGDCHPVCSDCHRAGKQGPYVGRETLLRRLYAAGRSISRCQCCDAEGTLEIHFIRPLALGGDAESPNLLVLCGQCHAKAHLPGARIKGTAIERGLPDEV
jgi:5-methylcytosine-specific restriction endonuclease McrA